MLHQFSERILITFIFRWGFFNAFVNYVWWLEFIISSIIIWLISDAVFKYCLMGLRIFLAPTNVSLSASFPFVSLPIDVSFSLLTVCSLYDVMSKWDLGTEVGTLHIAHLQHPPYLLQMEILECCSIHVGCWRKLFSFQVKIFIISLLMNYHKLMSDESNESDDN